MTDQYDPNKVTSLDENAVHNRERRIAFADNAEALLRRILSELGYENSDKVTPQDLILSIIAWLTLFTTMKREPNGSYASFWARAFLDVCKDLPVDDAAECADKMTGHFAKRYPPMLDDVAIDEDSRDTQSDLQSAMVELDKQTQLVWQLESELAAIRKTNEHHASELASVRVERQRDNDYLNGELTKVRTELARAESLVCKLSETFTAEKNRTKDALVPLAKPERVEPGQQWAFVDSVHYVHAYVVRESDKRASFKSGEMIPPCDFMIQSSAWHYLGTDKS